VVISRYIDPTVCRSFTHINGWEEAVMKLSNPVSEIGVKRAFIPAGNSAFTPYRAR
jgi:hypothetical protein